MAQKLPIKPQFTREFQFDEGICNIKDSNGHVFLVVRLDELTPEIARQMCLQQFVRAVTDQAVESMRLGVPESEAKAAVIGAHDRVLKGEYRPRSGKSPNGIRKAVDGVRVLSKAAYEAGYRSVSHAGQTYAFMTADEAYLAFKWLKAQPQDANGITGRMVYLDIGRQPEIRARTRGATTQSLARAALGTMPISGRPLPSPS
jgi:hypothetical protein